MAREGKIPTVKIKPGKNNKLVVRVPYNQDLIKKMKNILREIGCLPYKNKVIIKRSLFGHNS